jgi:single-strand DNA-binding protein
MSQPLTIVGNLAADVELKFTPQGKAVAKFPVATSERFKNEKGEWDSRNLTYWNVSVWDKQAENVADTLSKGDEVIIYGKAYTTSWEDKNTGEKRSRMEVTATKVAVSLNRVSAKLTKVANNATPVFSEDVWSKGVTTQGGGWGTNPSEDTPPF